MFRKFRDFIYKGVSFESEESQFILLMRNFYIITAMYIVAFYIFGFVTGIIYEAPALLIWLPLHVEAFFTTYHCKRRLVFHIFSGGILGWLVVSIYLLGADYGAHYFIYPLMVISFFATYRNFKGKLIYMLFLLALNIAMYFYGKVHEPVIILTPVQGDVLNVMYTVTLFMCMFAICVIFSNTNQTALERLTAYNRCLKRLAETDPLTGLMNRRSMYTALEDCIENSERFTVAIGDIDFFKKVNDTKGHNFGDEVLRVLSAFFAEYMEDYGVVCRWGGEEFLFLFPNLSVDAAYNLVSEMKEHIVSMPITYEDETINVTMTFGLAENDGELLVADIVRRADEKLYNGKMGGRNTVVR